MALPQHIRDRLTLPAIAAPMFLCSGVALAAAVLPESPAIWPEAAGNIAFVYDRGDMEHVKAAIGNAPHVVECDIVNNRVVAASLETRGALGEFDASSGRLHLTASAAGAHGG